MASGDTLLIFTPHAAEPPATGYGTLDERNQHPVVDLNELEEIRFSSVMPRHYAGGGITAYLHYAMSSATSGKIQFETAFERIGDQAQNLDTDGFGAAITTTGITVPPTSGRVDIVSIDHAYPTYTDAIIAGEGFRFRVKRLNNTAAGDLELVFIELKET